MKERYDFSRGVRGKFYRAGAILHFPVYLRPEIAESIAKLAAKKKTDVETLVNEWLKRDIGIVEVVK